MNRHLPFLYFCYYYTTLYLILYGLLHKNYTKGNTKEPPESDPFVVLKDDAAI